MQDEGRWISRLKSQYDTQAVAAGSISAVALFASVLAFALGIPGLGILAAGGAIVLLGLCSIALGEKRKAQEKFLYQGASK